ncbi:hypothetical protein BH11BAC7_BH11BAC7_14280 [soil metagenome]
MQYIKTEEEVSIFCGMNAIEDKTRIAIAKFIQKDIELLHIGYLYSLTESTFSVTKDTMRREESSRFAATEEVITHLFNSGAYSDSLKDGGVSLYGSMENGKITEVFVLWFSFNDVMHQITAAHFGEKVS